METRFSVSISCPKTAEKPIFFVIDPVNEQLHITHALSSDKLAVVRCISLSEIFFCCCCLLLFLYPKDEGRGDGCLLQIVAGKRLLWWQDGARATRQDQARHQVGAIFGN